MNNIFNIIISASPKKNFYWKLNLTRATTYGVERQNIECEMSERGLEWILRNLDGERIRRGEGAAREGVVEDVMTW